MTNDSTNEVDNGSRRDLLKTLTGAAAISSVALVSAPVFANAAKKGSVSGGAAYVHSYQSVIESCADCSKVGEVCLDHCIKLVMDDDTSIASCLASVRVMLPVIEATITLASAQSEFFMAQAKVCKTVCEACRDECEKHAHHHQECNACMESCDQCIEALDKVLAA